jgi:uncharacterized protein DUF1236
LLGAAAISLAVGTAAFGQTSPNAQDEKKPRQDMQQNRPSAQTPQGDQQGQQGGQAKQENQQGSKGGQAQEGSQKGPQSGQAQEGSQKGPQGGQAQQGNQQSPKAGQAQQGNQQGSGGQAQQQGSQPSQQGQTTQQGAQPSPQPQQQGSQNPPTGQARGTVSLNQQQQTRVAAVISKEKIRPLTKVDFSLSIGTRVPDTVLISTVPDAVIEIVPQYRGYGYFVTNDQIVIVEPNTKEIVTLLPLSSSRASNEGASDRTQFTSEQRASIRKHTAERNVVHKKRQARAHVRYKIGETLSDDEELYEFPEAVYTEVPTVRTYRYVPREEGGLVLVEPRGRKIIDVIE